MTPTAPAGPPPGAADSAIARARSGDPGAFLELAHHHEPSLREIAERRSAGRAGDAVLLRALVEAYRAMPAFEGAADEVAAWMAAFIEPATAADAGAAIELWPRLAEELAALAPALAAPETPERRFPVVPTLGSGGWGSPRRRRGKA